MVKTFSFGTSKGFSVKCDDLEVKFISYGARITEISFGGKDLTLGFDTLEDYKESTIYCGATIGRYGNRIGNSSFTLNGKEYKIDVNENKKNTLHGGTLGFDRFEWESEIVGENSIRFFRTSTDGEMGFPGNLEVSVTYTVEGNALAIHYDGISDADTVFNPTNHAYFNLDGYNGEDCRNMLLSFRAEHYLPVDELLIPTGEIAKVDNTRFDFRSLRPISDDYDHCFVVGMNREYKNICTLISEKSKIRMDIETDLPGIQFYTCSGCNEKAGKGGIPLHIHHAVALETQFFPDAPNHKNFPSTLLKKGERFESDTKYIFSFIK